MSNLVLDLATNSKTPYVLSASIFKPLYVWLALKTCTEKQLSNINLKTIITESNNAETDKLIQVLTLKTITEQFNFMLNNLTSKIVLDIPETWGRYKITGKLVYELYSAFLTDNSVETKTVLELMKQTQENQKFNFINPNFATKAGWDLVDNQMSLLVVNIVGNQIQVFVSISYPLNETESSNWHSLEKNEPEKLPALHAVRFERQLKLFKKLADI